MFLWQRRAVRTEERLLAPSQDASHPSPAWEMPLTPHHPAKGNSSGGNTPLARNKCVSLITYILYTHRQKHTNLHLHPRKHTCSLDIQLRAQGCRARSGYKSSSSKRLHRSGN